MGSGGANCHYCRQQDCVCLPEPAYNDDGPICPFCGQDFPHNGEEFEHITCDCGNSFQTQKLVSYVSKPYEMRTWIRCS